MSADLVEMMEQALRDANRCTSPMTIPQVREKKVKREAAASPVWQAEAALEGGESAQEYIERITSEARGKMLHAIWTQEARELERIDRQEDHAWALFEEYQAELALLQRRSKLAAEEAEQKSRIRELLRVSIHGKPAVLDAASGLVLEPAILGERELRARGRVAEANALRFSREAIKALIPTTVATQLPVEPRFGGSVESSRVNQEVSHTSVRASALNRISKRPVRVNPRRGHRADARHGKRGVHPQTREESVNAIIHANLEYDHETGAFVLPVVKTQLQADSVAIRPAPRQVRRAVAIGLASAWPKGATLIPMAKPVPSSAPSENVIQSDRPRLADPIKKDQKTREEATKAPELPQWALERAGRAINMAKGLCPCGKSARLSGIAKIGHFRKCLESTLPMEPVNRLLSAKL